MKKNILIIGDSFAAPQDSINGNIGWPELLKRKYNVTNLAEGGVSEYKIYKQLELVNLKKFDEVIVSHTSFYRIPIESHPLYKNSKLHKNCDLIFTDVENKKNKDKRLKIAYDFFNEFFWEEYFLFSNNLIFEKIFSKTQNNLHITFFDNFYDDRVLNLKHIFDKKRGDVNHLNRDGNILVFKKLLKLVN